MGKKVYYSSSCVIWQMHGNENFDNSERDCFTDLVSNFLLGLAAILLFFPILMYSFYSSPIFVYKVVVIFVHFYPLKAVVWQPKARKFLLYVASERFDNF